MTDRKDYQDYVIKDGKLIGDFEAMYRDFDDPWLRGKREVITVESDLLKRTAMMAQQESGRCGALDIGCGIGSSIAAVSPLVERAVGIDVSETAVKKAREREPGHTFIAANASDLIKGTGGCAGLDTSSLNFLIMSHVTWYILDDLPALKDWLLEHWRGKYVIHFLSVYAPGVQTYGLEFFSTHRQILDWWDLQYLEHGDLSRTFDGKENLLSYFFARVE